MSKPVGEETVKWIKVKKYDQLLGNFYRDIRPNHIFHLASPASTSVGTLGAATASTVISSTEEVFITDLCYSASSAGMELYGLYNGTSTILPIRLGANLPQCLSQPRNAPLYKLEASSTLCFYSDAAGTVTVFVSGVIEPVSRYVETTDYGVS